MSQQCCETATSFNNLCPLSQNYWKETLLGLFSGQGLQNFRFSHKSIKVWWKWDKITKYKSVKIKNKSVHWVKWRKTALQTFDEVDIRLHINYNTFIVLNFFIFANPLFASWSFPTIPYSTPPWEQIFAYLPSETVLTYTENLKIDAFTETAKCITSSKKRQYTTIYSTGCSGFCHRKFIIL